MEYNISEIAKNAQKAEQFNRVLVRGNREPIDSTSVMLTYEELNNYLSYSYTVYDGQVVSVSDLNNNSYNGLYYVKYNSYSYTSSKLALNNDLDLLNDKVYSTKELLSLINSYFGENLVKNEKIISLAIDYLYSYISNISNNFNTSIDNKENEINTYTYNLINELNNDFTYNINYINQKINDIENTLSNLNDSNSNIVNDVNNKLNNLKNELNNSISNSNNNLNNKINLLKQDLNVLELQVNSLSGDYITQEYFNNEIYPGITNSFNNMKNYIDSSDNNVKNELIGLINQNTIPELSIDNSNNSFVDKDNNRVYLSLRKENNNNILYFSIWQYPKIVLFKTDKSTLEESVEYGTVKDLTLSYINCQIEGSGNNFTNTLNIKRYYKTNENGNYTLDSSYDYIFTSNNNQNSTYTFNNNLVYDDNNSYFGYKVDLKLNTTDEKNNQIESNTISILFNKYTCRYYLKTNLSNINNILNSTDLTTIDNNGYVKRFNNYTLPASQSNEYIYLFFRADSKQDYTSCVLNGASPSDNTTVYGPITIINSKGVSLNNYYYWKKKLASVQETVTLN